MANKTNIITNKTIEHFADIAPIKSLNITPWWNIKGEGRHYAIESFNVGTFAHLCTISMKGFLGIDKAESLTCVPYAKDLPILYIEYEKHFANETLNIDFYDTLMEPIPTTKMEQVKNAFAHLPVYEMEPHWFDSLKLAPSDAKKGKKMTKEFAAYADRVIDTYAHCMPTRTFCDEKLKAEKVSGLMEGLITKGSPTMDFFKKCLGDKDAAKFLREAVFGMR